MERILIVDDDDELRENIKEILQDSGFNTDDVSSGHEALGLLKFNKYNVILLDLMMPGMNGMETLSKIRENNKLTKVIMLTAFATVANAVEAIKKGASDYITKPFKINELVNTIRCCIEESKFEEDVKNVNIDDTLSSISNTIRREIIYLLSQNESMKLMKITRKLKIEDHTKVVFHLRTLKESGLIEQSKDKSYSLTNEGRRVLKSLEIFSKNIVSA
jgi:DNA-binding response OmpR family regulator